MTTNGLVTRSLRHYWRTNLAVAFGVAVAVSALSGAIVVGESVRTSLRELALSRLGRADVLLTAGNPFTEDLAGRLAAAPDFAASWTGAVPVLALEGAVTHERSGSRAAGVQVFGVDDRFWRFNEVAGVTGPAGRDAFLSAALARELGADEGDALVLRVQKPSSIPAGVIQGRRDEPGQAVRLSTARILDRGRLGEFSPRPHQGAARGVFVPLDRLQRDLDLPRRVNMVLAGGPDTGLLPIVERELDLADLGIRLRALPDALAVESDAGLLTQPLEEAAIQAARAAGTEPIPVLTYLATAIEAGGREVPYSLVSAIPERLVARAAGPNAAAAEPSGDLAPIWLTQWAADDLGASPGEEVTLRYYLWSDEDGLTTASAAFTLAGVLPMQGLAVDSGLTPDYPGVSTSASISAWDPPFPVDLKRIRPRDEEYWDRYRTAPKAFVRIEDGQELWQSRYGRISSLRLEAGARPVLELEAELRAALRDRASAEAADFGVVPVRANALAAASGTTDFGAYFFYFSFFLVVSSLLLAMLFFRLGVEQRAREVGLLAAVGYPARTIRKLLVTEGAVVATAGAAMGMGGALAYSALIMLALRTWWVDAVGTTELEVHASPASLAAGAAAGVLAGVACVAWSLRILRRSSARQLLTGAWVDADRAAVDPADGPLESRPRRTGDSRSLAASSAAVAAALAGAGLAGWISATAAFFGSGSVLLLAGLFALAGWLRGTSRRTFAEGRWPIARFGLRNARYRPSRSVLSVALIAAATFLIVSVGAFRRGTDDLTDPRSPSGGYALIAESVAPLMHDPGTADGRDALGLGPGLRGIEVARFRLRPGDDASCLNLYRPQTPRLLGAADGFVEANRFSFTRSLASTPAEDANPWRLLHREFDDGAIPVIGDATSLTYVFHLDVGDDYEMQGPGGAPLRLRIVAALRDSVLQSELVMSDASFTRLFPRQEGFRVFLVGTESGRTESVARELESALQDFGMDVQSTAERLASYHRVENTYLNTFQALGALGLVLGTFGLGTVLLRNVLERRRELALLRATGYRRTHLTWMVLAESAFLIVCGLGLGAASAAVAVAPAYLERAQDFPLLPTLGLLAAVLAAGLLSTLMATRVVARSPLLEALKND